MSDCDIVQMPAIHWILLRYLEILTLTIVIRIISMLVKFKNEALSVITPIFFNSYPRITLINVAAKSIVSVSLVSATKLAFLIKVAHLSGAVPTEPLALGVGWDGVIVGLGEEYSGLLIASLRAAPVAPSCPGRLD